MSISLSEENVVAIAKQLYFNDVSFVGINCNWGAPISGRFDTDYFDLWAAVKNCDKNDKVYLYGAKREIWNLEYEFKFVKNADNIGIYKISLTEQYYYPDEFVIRLNKSDGNVFYDNNDYRNFRVEQYSGRFISSVQNGDIICYFKEPISTRLLKTNP